MFLLALVGIVAGGYFLYRSGKVPSFNHIVDTTVAFFKRPN